MESKLVLEPLMTIVVVEAGTRESLFIKESLFKKRAKSRKLLAQVRLKIRFQFFFSLFFRDQAPARCPGDVGSIFHLLRTQALHLTVVF